MRDTASMNALFKCNSTVSKVGSILPDLVWSGQNTVGFVKGAFNNLDSIGCAFNLNLTSLINAMSVLDQCSDHL